MKQFFGSLFGSNNNQSDRDEDLSTTVGNSSSSSSSDSVSLNSPSDQKKTKRNQAIKRQLPSASSLPDSSRFTSNKRTKIFTSGSNDSAQLGFEKNQISSTEEWKEVTQIKGLSDTESEEILSRVNIIAVGRSHSLIATSDGLVYGCGKNNYNQLKGSGSEENVELFSSLNDDLERAMSDGLKKVLRNQNWNENMESYLKKHFTKIESVDFLSCGWFHTIIVVNRNIILGAGHSYFSQLFGADFNANFQLLNCDLDIFSTNIDSNPYETYRVTDVTCGTFSTGLVINRSLIYSCGEASWKSKLGTFKVPNLEALKCPVIKLGQTDSGVYAQLEDNSLYFISKDSSKFDMIEKNVRSFAGGHMSNASHWIDSSSPLDKPVIKNNEGKHYDLFSGYCELSSMDIQLFGGYYCSFGTINKKILFTQGGKYTGVPKETLPFQSPYHSVISPSTLSLKDKPIDKKLAELLFHERYDILDVQSGCDVNMLLIAEFRGSTDNFRQKLLNQSTDDNLQKFCDIQLTF